MKQPILNNVDTSSWEVPQYQEITLGPKRHRYALVIPVINEGERIKEQLKKIHQASLPVDIIIADGGSEDGSLNNKLLMETNVRTLLVLKGLGKLSAQLRMAYCWILCQGYLGVVTIDGNGKDGIDGVSGMVNLLEQGYDYVQGSRYLAGGKAINTPLERTFANRFIHAPLLSMAGRHWFTDTTNGFRAYSASYLINPKVKPFRDIFRRYELLFYLTVRAGQVGMKIGHLPVKRSYPTGSFTPTKINSFFNKASVLKQTIAVAFGRYNP